MNVCLWIVGLAGILVAPQLLAAPKCDADTFTQEKSCVYASGTIGLAGIGNQIMTANGSMFFHRGITRIGGQPLEVESILFRVDDSRTLVLPARNVSRVDVSCSGRLCTWHWSVAAPISGPVLAELAAARKLVIAFQGQGQRIEESELKRGGRIFSKFYDDIQTYEPGVLDTAQDETQLLVGGELRPYASAMESSE